MFRFVHIEAIDFSEHIDDTNQLSIIRGSSLALSNIDSAFGGGAVFSGSSSALFSGDPRDLDISSTPAARALQHMRFVQGAGEDASELKAMRLAHARARFAQITGNFKRKPLSNAPVMCALTRIMPGDRRIENLNEDQISRLNLGTDRSNASIASSQSAQDRRDFGKQARTTYLRDKLSNADGRYGKLAFTNDLPQLCSSISATSPKEEKEGVLPISVKDRIALFYTDGNHFSKIRAELEGTLDALKRFSHSVDSVIVENALKAFVDFLVDGADEKKNGTAVHFTNTGGSIEQRLRFEILICGGDEFCFIAPSWLGIKLAQIFFDAISAANHNGTPLQFKAGLVFANCKTPIRPLREAATELADRCRIDGRNSIGIQAFESIQPTSQGFFAVRAAIFGDVVEDPARLSADEFSSIIKTIAALKKVGLPRSQLYKAIRAARWSFLRSDDGHSENAAARTTQPNVLTDDRAKSYAKEWIDGYKGPNSGALKLAFPEECNVAIRAWHIAHLWDYVWEPPYPETEQGQ